MQNIGSCHSCNSLQKTRRATILGKELNLKNYLCSEDGVHYREKPEKIRLQLSICPTSYCSASCPFCIAKNTHIQQYLDLEKLRAVLIRLKDEELVRGVSFTGGEPFTDVGRLNETVSMVFEIFGTDMEISITTNGSNLKKLHELQYLQHIDAIHISRHHYKDEINEKLFGIAVPTTEELREIMHSVSYRDIFVLNCMLLKDYISTLEEAHRFLDFAIYTGAKKVAFMACSPVNSFAKSQQIDYTEVLKAEDPSLLFTRGYCDFEYCRCQDGIYVSNTGELIEFYGRNTNATDCKYCRGVVYGADNHLRAGYEGEIII